MTQENHPMNTPIARSLARQGSGKTMPSPSHLPTTSSRSSRRNRGSRLLWWTYKKHTKNMFENQWKSPFLRCKSTLSMVILSGWWFFYPSEKYEFVNWDDDIPNIWENKKWQPNHQPVIIVQFANGEKLQSGYLFGPLFGEKMMRIDVYHTKIYAKYTPLSYPMLINQVHNSTNCHRILYWYHWGSWYIPHDGIMLKKGSVNQK